MTRTVEFDDQARRELRRLDRSVQQRVLRYLRERVAGRQDPRLFGKALVADRIGLWRYRVGDYRICRLEDTHLVVLVVKLGHRREVYE